MLRELCEISLCRLQHKKRGKEWKYFKCNECDMNGEIETKLTDHIDHKQRVCVLEM